MLSDAKGPLHPSAEEAQETGQIQQASLSQAYRERRGHLKNWRGVATRDERCGDIFLDRRHHPRWNHRLLDLAGEVSPF